MVSRQGQNSDSMNPTTIGQLIGRSAGKFLPTTDNGHLTTSNSAKYWPLRVESFSPQYAPHFKTRTPRDAAYSSAARTWRNQWMVRDDRKEQGVLT
jgi:hypothetical protein